MTLGRVNELVTKFKSKCRQVFQLYLIQVHCHCHRFCQIKRKSLRTYDSLLYTSTSFDCGRATRAKPSRLSHPICYNSPPTSRLNELMLLPAPWSVSHFLLLVVAQQNNKQLQRKDQCRAHNFYEITISETYSSNGHKASFNAIPPDGP